MDPDVCLQMINALMNEMDGCKGQRDEDDYVAMVDGLVAQVRALDAWLSSGGFLPKAWSR